MVWSEHLVDVDHELGIQFVFQGIVTSEDFHIAVIHKCRMGLDHHFLDDSCTRHCVVQYFQIVVDALRCDFLAQPLFQSLMSQVHTYNAGSPDIIPFLLHSRIVDIVEVVAIAYNICSTKGVRGQLSLTQWDTS